MKDEPRKPLEALGDEALEARIVAWVLGEASAFEAAELEERCAGDPDLKRFADRMREVHRLIEEDGKPVDAGDWKLPETKRRKIVDLLGVEPAPRPVKRSFIKRRMVLSLAACLLATLIALPLILERAPVLSESKSIVSYMAPSAPAVAGVVREFDYPTEYKALEMPNRPSPASFRGRGDVDEFEASPGNSLRGASLDVFKGKARQSASPDEMASITGSGIRSGEGEISSGAVFGMINANGTVTNESLIAGEPTAPYQWGLLSQEEKAPAPPISKPVPTLTPVKPEIPNVLAANSAEPDSVDDFSTVRDGRIAEEVRYSRDRSGDVVDGLGERPELQAERESQLTSNFAYESKPDSLASATVPELGELPMLGRLFDGGSDEGGFAGGGGDESQNFWMSGGARMSAELGGLATDGLDGKDGDLVDRQKGKILRREIPSSELSSIDGDYEWKVDPYGVSRAPGKKEVPIDALGVDARSGQSAAPWNGDVDYGSSISKRTLTESEPDFGDSRLAESEMMVRGSSLEVSDKLRDEARDAYSGGDYGLAREKYGESLDLLAQVPLAEERKDFLEKSLADAEVADAENLRRTGRYDEARELLETAQKRDPLNRYAGQSLANLDDPIRTNPATDGEMATKVDDIRRDLYTAEGAYNLGKYDQAKTEYESVLGKDPYNAAARRGLERVEAAKTDYYRAAYDQSRAELLMQVDDAWELALPSGESDHFGLSGGGFEGEVHAGYGNRYEFRLVDKGTKSSGESDEAKDSAESSLASAEARLSRLKSEIGTTSSRPPEFHRQLVPEADSNGRKLSELRDAIQKQQDSVEDKRKTLSTIIRNQKLAYKESVPVRDGGFYEASEMAGSSYSQLSEKTILIESQIEALSKYDDAQLMTYASGLDLPENIIRDLHPRYLEERRKLEQFERDGLGQAHADVAKQREAVEAIKSDLNEGVDALRETLKAQLELARESQQRLAENTHPRIGGAVDQGLGRHGFDDAMNDLRSAEALLGDLEGLLEKQKVETAIANGEPIPEKKAPKQVAGEIQMDHGATLDAMAEVSAADEAYSTFSLHVSDASFKLAAAAIKRGEVPTAESVRPEEFYNAFDYGDPAPTANEPVACAVEQCAHPAFPQRNLLRIAVRTGADGRNQSVPLNLTLLLDNSGSMEREDRAEGLNQAVAGLSSLLKEGDTVTVAGFSRQPRLLADRVDGKDGVTLNGLVAQTPAEGGTNLEEALKLGGELAKRQFKEGAQNRVVLFTDGAANLGDADPESLNGKVEQLRNEGIAFDAAGFGADGLNDRLLERLTRNGNGRYYVVDDAEDADEVFAKQLAGAFRPAAENVKVQVIFNPSRVGNYKLIGFEEHRLKKEDFRNDAVDAAEMASEEAGVALYQFEILPEGQGEVGEVSVRFRDTASGEMVERSWPIPYDPQAPSFDTAKPGLQLAGIAAFVAEKLRGAPLADAVNFSQLRGVMGRVKAEYDGNPRVEQLEAMMRR